MGHFKNLARDQFLNRKFNSSILGHFKKLWNCYHVKKSSFTCFLGHLMVPPYMYFLNVERNGHEPKIEPRFWILNRCQCDSSLWLIKIRNMQIKIALARNVGFNFIANYGTGQLINPILIVKLYHFCNSLLLTLIWKII